MPTYAMFDSAAAQVRKGSVEVDGSGVVEASGHGPNQ